MRERRRAQPRKQGIDLAAHEVLKPGARSVFRRASGNADRATIVTEGLHATQPTVKTPSEIRPRAYRPRPPSDPDSD